MFSSRKTGFTALKQTAPDHSTFSDQTYRHRRNLLLLSAFILASVFSGARAASLPFGISFLNATIAPNYLFMLGVGYFLFAFGSSAVCEFKSRADEEEDEKSSLIVMASPTTLSAKAATAYSTIKRLRDLATQGTPTEGTLSETIEQLTAYAKYQDSIWRYWQLRFVIDFWLPILLGIAAIVSLTYLQCTGTSILPITP